MRVLWLLLLLLAGLCQARDEEAAGHLQAIEGRRLERTGFDASCSGCSASAEKKSSSVVIPTLNLPTILGDKTDIVHHALSTQNDLVGPAQDPVTDADDNIRIILGNLVSYITSDPNAAGAIEHTDPILAGLGSLFGIPALSIAKFGSFLAVIKFIKTSIAELIARGLEVANLILAVIGVGALIGYIVENDGRLGVLSFGLTGPDSESESDSSNRRGGGWYARSFMDSPAAQGLTNLVYEAISKYD